MPRKEVTSIKVSPETKALLRPMKEALKLTWSELFRQLYENYHQREEEYIEITFVGSTTPKAC